MQQEHLAQGLAGLMAPTRGAVTIGGSAPSALRGQGRIGRVFQQANLMPWLLIDDNVRLLIAEIAQPLAVVENGRRTVSPTRPEMHPPT
jgi:ABC-type nitrate/sulfonate/bicarbonate transport system ATPase subunit